MALEEKMSRLCVVSALTVRTLAAFDSLSTT